MATYNRRKFLSTTAALGVAGAGSFAASRLARASSANDTIGVGLIGCGGRGGEHVDMLGKVPGVQLVAFCDPDSERSNEKAKEFPGAKTYADLRKLLEDPAVDVVTIATCNHWHCLAAVWACAAGKDVYCEKPLSHSMWEGRALIDAAKKHNRIVAVGTQQRSDPIQAEAKDFLHDQRALGKVQSVVISRFGVRASVGKLDAPLHPPKSVNYNLWLGPAQDEPIFRQAFHYDWHWSWNTGDGECGNWGVHVLDDVINVVFRDRAKLPTRVCSGGGRVLWDDAGQSPNVHLGYLEAEGTPILFALSNLPAKPGSNQALRYHDTESGYVVHCEGGEYRGRRGGGAAVDRQGKVIRRFNGDSGAGHMNNFFAAVRERRPEMLTAPVEIGHSSAGWSHVLNAAVRTAKTPGLTPPKDATSAAGFEQLKQLIDGHLAAHGIEHAPGFRNSEMLTLDVEAERFTGDGAEQANALLGMPDYRGEFAIPG